MKNKHPQKNRNSQPAPHSRRSLAHDEPWKSEVSGFDPFADISPGGKPVARHTASAPPAEAILARLRQGHASLDELIGHFGLKKLPEQTALEKRLLELGRAGQVRLDQRGRLQLVTAATMAPAVATKPAQAKPLVAPAAPAEKAAAKPAAKAKPAKETVEPLSRLIAQPPVAMPTPAPVTAPARAATSAARVMKPGDELVGRVSAHRDGFGFLVPDRNGEAKGEDVFLPAREMRGLMTGDRVRVRLSGVDATGRLSGSFQAMLTTAPRFAVGRLRRDTDTRRWLLTPDNQKAQPFELVIAASELGGASEGQVVRAEIISTPGGREALQGRVTEIIGEHLAPGLEIEIALRRHDLPYEWPEAVEAEAAAYAPTVPESAAKGRVDLRKLPLVTIDGVDARDFDDAVYAESLRGGWRLIVAIADVSAYVAPGSALDEEAEKRGTSVYFPRRVIPMLPEALSNGLCSLNPNVDRLCLVCEMRLDKSGEVASAKFYEGLMRSQARLIYDDVATMLDEPHGDLARAHAALLPQLQTLDAVFGALFAARTRRGAIDFEGQETKFVFTSDAKIERIVPVVRNKAHRLIEECMIAANVEAAKFVSAKETPALYRIHESPDPIRVVTLREFLAGRGLSLGGGEAPLAIDFARVTEQARGRPDTGLIHMMILRTMSQARYSPEGGEAGPGHFGLALTHYAHFTSPIRRYPDLLLHRAIKHVIKRKKPSSFEYSAERMAALGEHCSMTERRADDATRDVTSWLKCEFMSHRLGETLDGVVSAVTAFGMFVDLKGLFIEGLVHISALGDHYTYDAKAQRLVGRRSGHAYELGQMLRVQIARVSLEERKIDLTLPELSGSSEPVQGGRDNLPGKRPAWPQAGRNAPKSAAPSKSKRTTKRR